MSAPLFTTITTEHWRRALPQARTRRREQRQAVARQIRAAEEARGLRAFCGHVTTPRKAAA